LLSWTKLDSLYFNHCVMRFPRQKVESRREFFRASARYAFLALVSAAAGLAARPRAAGRQRCVNRAICSSCGVFAGCGLPQALSAKRAREKG
jgi:hypothetical protein